MAHWNTVLASLYKGPLPLFSYIFFFKAGTKNNSYFLIFKTKKHKEVNVWGLVQVYHIDPCGKYFLKVLCFSKFWFLSFFFFWSTWSLVLSSRHCFNQGQLWVLRGLVKILYMPGFEPPTCFPHTTTKKNCAPLVIR